MALIPKVIGNYKKLMSAHRKEAVVSVITAQVRHLDVTLLTLLAGVEQTRAKTASRFSKYSYLAAF